MNRWIDADKLKENWTKCFDYEYNIYDGAYIVRCIDSAPSIDLDDYVPKEFHDKTCEAMAQRHQEEIANMVSIVRCKECRHWLGFCSHIGGLFEPDDDDFCSYGERRE